MKEINERGNHVQKYQLMVDRYYFDFEKCKETAGWKPLDTERDAWHFGIWAHDERRELIIYSDGEVSQVRCPTTDCYRAELNALTTLYGLPPMTLKGIGRNRNKMEHFDEPLS